MVCFILGIVFGVVILPLLDGFVSIILSYFELLKTRIAVQIHKYNKEIENCHESSRQIGFVVEEESEENEDDDL